MARLKKYMLLKKLGMVPAPLTAEQMEQIEAYRKHEVERAKGRDAWVRFPSPAKNQVLEPIHMQSRFR